MSLTTSPRKRLSGSLFILSQKVPMHPPHGASLCPLALFQSARLGSSRLSYDEGYAPKGPEQLFWARALSQPFDPKSILLQALPHPQVSEFLDSNPISADSKLCDPGQVSQPL